MKILKTVLLSILILNGLLANWAAAEGRDRVTIDFGMVDISIPVQMKRPLKNFL